MPGTHEGNIVSHIAEAAAAGLCRCLPLRLLAWLILLPAVILATAEHLHLVGHDISAVAISAGVFVLPFARL